MPTNFRELAALFEQNREGGLYAQLYQHVHPVRCEAGLLEIRVTGEAAPSLASRLTQCLTQWTGQRWMVSITDKQGAMSLAEYDAIKEKKRQERVHAHPLMQAVMLAFPDAKTLSLKQKIVDVLAVTDDDAVDNELVPLLDDL